MSREHHLFVRDRETGVWHHETSFSDRDDALAEAAEYRERPTIRAAKVKAGPGAAPAVYAWIKRELDALNATPVVVSKEIDQ